MPLSRAYILTVTLAICTAGYLLERGRWGSGSMGTKRQGPTCSRRGRGSSSAPGHYHQNTAGRSSISLMPAWLSRASFSLSAAFMPLPFFFLTSLTRPRCSLPCYFFQQGGSRSISSAFSHLTCWSRVTFTQTPPSWVGRRGSGWLAHLGKWPAQKGPLFSHPVGLATLSANNLVRKNKWKRSHCVLHGAVHGADVDVVRECCFDWIFVCRLKLLFPRSTSIK